MLVYNVIALLCCAALIAQVLGLVIAYAVKDRAGRIKMVRSFKDGPCGIIFVVAVPLYFIGYIFAASGRLDIITIFDAFFDALGKVFGLVILQYDLSDISALIAESDIYAVAVYACSWLVFFNTVAFVFSLTSQRLSEFFNRVAMFVTSRECLCVFGGNESSEKIVKSSGSRRVILIDNFSKERTEQLYLRGIPYHSASPTSTVKSMMRIAQRKKNTVVVINTLDDAKNMIIARAFVDCICALGKNERKSLYHRLSVYVFATPDHEEDYASIMKNGDGILRCADKYRMLAIDFIERYPLSFFLSSDQIDYSSSLVRDDVDINVIMLGFGKSNREIFLASVANNQFIRAGRDEPEQKQVKYYIFDKSDVRNDIDLNHTYYRIRNEILSDESSAYLPLPANIAEEYFFKMDIGSPDFYPELRNIINKNSKDANFVIIAFGSDIQNVNLAHKIIEKRKEWGIEGLTIFVKTSNAFRDERIESDKNCFFIGNFEQCAYNIEKIINGKINSMAMLRNEVYDIEYALKRDPDLNITTEYIEQNREKAKYRWFATLGGLKRDSNVYCCLSLRSKLNMMGLDICEDIGENNHLEALSFDEYYKVYSSDDMPQFTNTVSIDGKSIIKYPLEIKKSRRTNMAVQEHLRWNSFMISRGTVPATIDQILNEVDENGMHTDGKNIDCRRHGNLTTLSGLVKFRELIAKRDGKSELECDVISYDYQLLDDAYWLLSSCGYKIVNLNSVKQQNCH